MHQATTLSPTADQQPNIVFNNSQPASVPAHPAGPDSSRTARRVTFAHFDDDTIQTRLRHSKTQFFQASSPASRRRWLVARIDHRREGLTSIFGVASITGRNEQNNDAQQQTRQAGPIFRMLVRGLSHFERTLSKMNFPSFENFGNISFVLCDILAERRRRNPAKAVFNFPSVPQKASLL